MAGETDGASDEATQAAERLERALERIARATAERPAPPTPNPGVPDDLAPRLDTLIAQLRGALQS